MSGKTITGIVVAVGVIFALVLGVNSYTEIKKAEIQAEKEKAVVAATQQEKTERTEERSQFWQKLVPWGKYEEEVSPTPAIPENERSVLSKAQQDGGEAPLFVPEVETTNE